MNTNRRAVLIVDDEVEIRSMIIEYLESQGFATYSAANGAEMFQILDQETIDLVLLDRTMPGGDGVLLLPRVRADYGVPVIMLTALAEDEERIWGLEAGADDYIGKPFHWKELRARIQSVLRRTRRTMINEIQPAPPIRSISDQLQRRRAAVLFADVAGYVRLMRINEEATVRDWLKQRTTIIDPSVAFHKGRIVKLTGDGFLAEFGAADAALACAIEIQQANARHNQDVPPNSRMIFRMGINICEIVGDQQDIYGDGVNLAARLEALAEPGEICVSQAVRDTVPDRIAVWLESMGLHELKHIDKPVQVYRVRWQQS